MRKSTLRRIAQRVALRKLSKDECSGIKDIHKYVKCRAEKLKENGADEGAAFGTAWGIACKHKRDVLDPKNEVCTMPPSGYLKKKKASRDLARFFKKGEYLYNFFSEKKIREQMYEKEDQNGVAHIISTEVVVEFISKTKGGERKKIEQTLRMIDFKNGSVEHFIEHLANAIANLYGSSW